MHLLAGHDAIAAANITDVLLQLLACPDGHNYLQVKQALVDCTIVLSCQPLLALHISHAPEALQVCASRLALTYSIVHSTVNQSSKSHECSEQCAEYAAQLTSYVKDLIGWVFFAVFLSVFVYFYPIFLGHPDDHIPTLCFLVLSW